MGSSRHNMTAGYVTAAVNWKKMFWTRAGLRINRRLLTHAAIQYEATPNSMLCIKTAASGTARKWYPTSKLFSMLFVRSGLLKTCGKYKKKFCKTSASKI